MFGIVADVGYRATLLGPSSEQTVMTTVIWGRPARCLSNRFTDFGLGIDPTEVPDYPIAYDAGKRSFRREVDFPIRFRGSMGWTRHPLARATPAEESVALLSSELNKALTDRPTLCAAESRDFTPS